MEGGFLWKPLSKMMCRLFFIAKSVKFNSNQVYLYSTFHNTNHGKAALQKILSFYIIYFLFIYLVI